MRVPAFLLESSVGIEHLPKPTGRAGSAAAPPLLTRRAHVEGSAELVVDERADSDTRGQLITCSELVVLQLEDDVEPGGWVTTESGRHQVVNRKRLQHPAAPSHVELRVV